VSGKTIGGVPFDGIPWVHSAEDTIPDNPNVPWHRYTIDDLILTKTAKNPVVRGTPVDGVLAFIFPGIRSDAIYTPGTVFRITFKDDNGKPYTVLETAPVRELMPIRQPS
jgi:hypothetical protein